MSIPERPPVTANSVAKEYFGKELEAHASLQSPVTVIVHDACYGHRFSRPRATKNALASIVERPERIHATLLGAATAYVRLGGRHQDGQYMPRPKHDPGNVTNIPFQIRKTSRVIPLNHPSVTYVHGPKWMEELQIMCDSAEGKLAMNGKELVRPIGYGKDESGNALPKLHDGDLYLCAESLSALQGCLGGVCDAVDTIFSPNPTKRAFVCIRPPGHHCSSNFPSGFCWLNNVHVGISYAAMNHGLTHAAIIDFDLHHGDGSQNIAWDQNRKAQGVAKNAAAHKKTPIGYYSLHDINSYPCEWGDEEKVRNASLCIENAHGQSIWNVHLEPWRSHEEFWKLYETKYLVLLEKARVFLRSHTARLRAANHLPKAAIFISAGFDASEHEGAGMQRHSVNVPTDFYARITADLVKLCEEEDLGVDGRLISVLEGGYSDRALTSGVLSHICGLAGDTLPSEQQSSDILDMPKYQTINNWIPEVPSMAHRSNTPFSSDWWDSHNLEELEAIVAGRKPTDPKSLHDKAGNYSSPTHASTAKMSENARDRHSLSALQARLGVEAQYVPPPPDVSWSIASYELSRVIIPSDRQNLSCTHEELNAEANKARRERKSTIGPAVPLDGGMQLRDRRAKPPPTAFGGMRTSSRNDSRRTTIAAVSELPDPSLEQREHINGRPRRRSSEASSILSSFQGMKLSDENDAASAKLPASRTGNVSRAASTVPDKATKTVAVKKTRAPPAVKAPIKSKTSPRKPQATFSAAGNGVPAAKVEGSNGMQALKHETNDKGREASTSSQAGANGASKVDDMDSLTNGMKKISIKLKVPTPEEHAAKQQKVLEDKQKKPRALRKPAASRIAKPVRSSQATSTENFVPIQPKPVQKPTIELPTSAQAPVANNVSSSVAPVQAAMKSPSTIAGQSSLASVSTNPTPETEPFMPAQYAYSNGKASPVDQSSLPPSDTSATFFGPDAMQIDHAPAPAYVQQQEKPEGQPAQSFNPMAFPVTAQAQQNTPVQEIPWPPSSVMMPMNQVKEDLPPFTSQTPTPFSAVHVQKYDEEPQMQQHSIWDIPETPEQRRDQP